MSHRRSYRAKKMRAATLKKQAETFAQRSARGMASDDALIKSLRGALHEDGISLSRLKAAVKERRKTQAVASKARA